jgi:ATP-dependent RNA helicase RhlB
LSRKSSGSRTGQQSRNDNSDWDISSYSVEPAPGKVRFHDLDLDHRIMHAIADLGFQYCSPIQGQSLPHTLAGQDVVGKAQTGTGKTAAFLITIFEDLLNNAPPAERFVGEPRALILAPTRELVMQIAEDAKDLGRYTGLSVQALVGGMDYHKQHERLKAELVDIVVATPGRLIDFCTRNDLYLDRVEVLVIDEADRMLDMGFIPQVRRLVRMTPNNDYRQTLFFSATLTGDVQRLVEKWLHDPVTVEIEPDSLAASSVDQHIYMIGADEKYNVLRNVVATDAAESVIIFANRKDQTRKLFERLQRDGFSVGMLSGDVPQQKRVRTLENFRSGKLKILVATDVAGRGIHIDDISHVINYNLPEEPEDYVHRIGRTGRAGKTGTSISLACEDDALRLEPIEKLLGQKLQCEVPDAALMQANN